MAHEIDQFYGGNRQTAKANQTRAKTDLARNKDNLTHHSRIPFADLGRRPQVEVSGLHQALAPIVSEACAQKLDLD